MNTLSNVNEKTGIRFGYISANSLRSELVDHLLYESGFDHSHDEFSKELAMMNGWDGIGDAYDYISDSTSLLDQLEHYSCEEPSVSGEYEEVRYKTSYLGGALNFFIFESPIKSYVNLCSPCVPNCGNLDSIDLDMGFECYGIPNDWLTDY